MWLLVGISLEGWQIVAGGRSEAETTGTDQKKLHHEVVREFSKAPLIWHSVGVQSFPARTGGLRFATTTGYYLTALRAEQNLRVALQKRSILLRGSLRAAE